MKRPIRAVFTLLFGILVFSSSRSATAEDNCKSVRGKLVDQLRERLNAADAKVALLSVDTIEPITGNTPGYECTGVAIVQKTNGPQETIRFIYTVFTVQRFRGYEGIEAVGVGISYLCGEDKQWDSLYPVCLK
jgi:hypothetical protein